MNHQSNESREIRVARAAAKLARAQMDMNDRTIQYWAAVGVTQIEAFLAKEAGR